MHKASANIFMGTLPPREGRLSGGSESVGECFGHGPAEGVVQRQSVGRIAFFPFELDKPGMLEAVIIRISFSAALAG
jgi:hypothetical protein